jgi:dUTP pyrophosphatase
MEFELKLVNGADKSFIPAYGSNGAAGLDLKANVEKTTWLEPGETRLISTGIAIWIKNPLIVGLMIPRSGKGFKEGLVLGNGTGVIDSDYQGELFVAALNRNAAWKVRIDPGERIAQLVLVPIVNASHFNMVEEFSNVSERGEGKLGSTGK